MYKAGVAWPLNRMYVYTNQTTQATFIDAELNNKTKLNSVKLY